MRRDIERWRMTVPKSVAEGSEAQSMYCIADARADILELHDEIERLRAALADISDMSGGPNYEISHHTVKQMAIRALKK